VKELRRQLAKCQELDAEEARNVAHKKPAVESYDPSMSYVQRRDIKYRKGDLVAHLKRPEWGIGRVVADSTEDSVRVFFEMDLERSFQLPLDSLVQLG
jgi:hypothetical protein